MRVAIATPYYKECPDILRRCLDSVRAQTYPHIVHYMVADGHPQSEVIAEYPQVKHIVLPQAHANFGCTPRGIAAQCALAEEADVVCFLDADNLFVPGHVASVVQTYEEASRAGRPLDAVFSSRYLFLPGHEHLRMVPAADEAPGSDFVDTNCISLSRSAGFLWGVWCQLPRSLTPICDRAICGLMKHHQLHVAWTKQHTVLYESNWRQHYVQAGLPPPETGLHDKLLHNVGKGLTPEETWALLRVRWNVSKN
ncbi:MAG: glycosyltransferase [Ottowia sp.]|uniref:glycosyltransferase family 2 protein n=1 Tax=Ottowia sp. TaxID=1898956 RepID=UPI003C70DB88